MTFPLTANVTIWGWFELSESVAHLLPQEALQQLQSSVALPDLPGIRSVSRDALANIELKGALS